MKGSQISCNKTRTKFEAFVPSIHFCGFGAHKGHPAKDISQENIFFMMIFEMIYDRLDRGGCTAKPHLIKTGLSPQVPFKSKWFVREQSNPEIKRACSLWGWRGAIKMIYGRDYALPLLIVRRCPCINNRYLTNKSAHKESAQGNSAQEGFFMGPLNRHYFQPILTSNINWLILLPPKLPSQILFLCSTTSDLLVF